MKRRWFRRWVGEEQGSIWIQFLFLVPILLFLAFLAPLFTTVQTRLNYAENIKNRYLQQAQLDGGFTVETWDQLQESLAARRFDLTKVQIETSPPVGVFVPRGEEITLSIGFPRGGALNIFRLVMVDPPDPNELVWVHGAIMSEKR